MALSDSPVNSAVAQFLEQPPTSGKIWVAFSGGKDSTALLHALVKCGARPVAIHVNHGLSDDADRWQNHCQTFARELGVEYRTEAVAVRAAGRGLEAAAREARYNAIASLMASDDILVCAHHAGDQSETFFLRLLRGAGLRGLGGMSPSRILASGQHLCRPLLQVRRTEIEDYLRYHQLPWVEDESNAQLRFDRNFLRREVLPALRQRWPAIDVQVAATSAILRDSDRLLRDYLKQDLAECGRRSEELGESVSVEPLKRFGPERRTAVIREWLTCQQLPLPDRARTLEIEKLLDARVDAQPVVYLAGYTLRRFRGRLHAVAELPPIDAAWQARWQPVAPLSLPDGSVLSCGTGAEHLQFTVRYRRAGDRCKPLDRRHSQTLKKLLQEYQVPPWLRDRTPVVCCEGEIIAVGDYWRCASERCPPSLSFCWAFARRADTVSTPGKGGDP